MQIFYKSLNPYIVIVLIMGVLLTACGDSHPSYVENSAKKQLIISALPVGKADCILVEGDITIMVDTGERDDFEKISSFLDKKGISTIDKLVITHFDKDHVGSAAELVNAYEVKEIYIPDYIGTREEYSDFLEELEKKRDMICYVCKDKEKVMCSNLTMTLYPAQKEEINVDFDKEIDNEMSLVMRLQYGERSFLFTGDIEKNRIKQMLETEKEWDCDWIKMPHHGKYYKKLPSLLEFVSPQYAVICTDEEHLPSMKTLEVLDQNKIQWYITNEHVIVTICDGRTIFVEQERFSK